MRIKDIYEKTILLLERSNETFIILNNCFNLYVIRRNKSRVNVNDANKKYADGYDPGTVKTAAKCIFVHLIFHGLKYVMHDFNLVGFFNLENEDSDTSFAGGKCSSKYDSDGYSKL